MKQTSSKQKHCLHFEQNQKIKKKRIEKLSISVLLNFISAIDKHYKNDK